MPPKATPPTTYETLHVACNGLEFNIAVLKKALVAVNKKAEQEIPGKDAYAKVGSLEQAHVNAVAGGDPVAIAAALESWNKARIAYDRIMSSKKARIPSATLRRKWDYERRFALASYEDFLYYQNPTLRRHVREVVPKNVAAIQRRIDTGQYVRGLWYDPENDIGRSHAFLNAWRDQHIGDPNDRRNATHDKLHYITPIPRRMPTGVGKPHWPKLRPDREHLVFTTNDSNIEARRLIVEKDRGGTREDADMTHDRRRKAEIDSKVVENDIVLSEALRNTRNKDTGLYISAKERPNDWPVSYDCLGKARSGFICVDPQRVTRKHQSEERRRTRERDHEGENGGESDEGLEKEVRGRPEETAKLLLSTQMFEATYGRREFHAYGHLPPPSPVDSPPHSPRPPFYEEGDYNPTVDDDSVISDAELPAVVAPKASGRRTRGDAKREAGAAKGTVDRIMAAKRKVTPRRHREEEDLQMPDRPEDTLRKQIPVNVPVTNDLYERYKTDFRDHYGIRNHKWPIEKILVPYHPIDEATYLKKQFDKLPDYEKLPQPQDNLLGDDKKYMRPAPEGTSMSIIRNILLGNVTTHSVDDSIPSKDDNYKEPTRYETVPMKSNYWVKRTTDEDQCRGNDTDNGAESDDEGDLFTQSYRAGSGTSIPAPIPPVDPDMSPDHGADVFKSHRYKNGGFDDDDNNGFSRKRQRLE